ncbi:MAG: hypothetical protein IPP88_10030 [Betaproteobacteria bacterium]|nr:hypothetical protein [Betaproteobacteria bacterium]
MLVLTVLRFSASSAGCCIGGPGLRRLRTGLGHDPGTNLRPLVFGRVVGRMQPVAIVMAMFATHMTDSLPDVARSYSLVFLKLVGAVAAR